MYIRRIEINNIRSIKHFEMTFPEGQEAGWHVLIGDNGSGKSTIVRSVALGLLDFNDINAARLNWNDWLNQNAPEGNINLAIIPISDSQLESSSSKLVPIRNEIVFGKEIYRSESLADNVIRFSDVDITKLSFDGQIVFERNNYQFSTTYATRKGPWFSAAYGPFRRFTGGNSEKEKSIYTSNPRLGAHLSVFGEDVALSEALSYIRELYVKQLDKKTNENTVEKLKQFINTAELLPHNTFIDKIDSEGVYFRDGNGSRISALQMSDGYRSILSLTFELIRQLIRAYGTELVFTHSIKDNPIIDLPGVVLIDEVDAHLHPTWQTDIGQWFTKYFPNLQFIVTTHSPLVCRAAEKGSIWQLPAPGSDEVAHEITGDEKKRLVYGNVLDAYGTNAFGDNVARSESANDKLNELAELNIKSIMGQISPDEEKHLNELRSIFPTEG